MYCNYCFRDDNYGVCCECSESKYCTLLWDLHWENIDDCEFFEDVRMISQKSLEKGVIDDDE